MARPLVAIVGRPNVGKSALFNRIIRTRASIVDDTPGITRDRLYAQAQWCGRSFTLVDTGGIEACPAGDGIAAQVGRQAQMAIEEADTILFVVDARTGLTSEDDDVADILRKSGKPVIVAASKVDDPSHMDWGLYSLGLGELVPTSAIHGIGIADLLDAVVQSLPDDEAQPKQDEDMVRVAVIGRPNVGKSSLVNRILGEERSIVSEVPGTTRDAVDAVYEFEGARYIIVDTAGIRRRGRIDAGIENYSVLRALAAVERCDVAITVVDGTEEPSAQDTKIAGHAHEAGKAAVVAVNKWDIVDRDDTTARKFEQKLRSLLDFMPYAPVLFVSALTGRRIGNLLAAVAAGAAQYRRRVSTAMVNRVVQDAVLRNPPPPDRGREVRVYYATQVAVGPPQFAVWVNRPECVHFSYKRYLENVLRDAFGFYGTPIRVLLRQRD